MKLRCSIYEIFEKEKKSSSNNLCLRIYVDDQSKYLNCKIGKGEHLLIINIIGTKMTYKFGGKTGEMSDMPTLFVQVIQNEICKAC